MHRNTLNLVLLVVITVASTTALTVGGLTGWSAGIGWTLAAIGVVVSLLAIWNAGRLIPHEEAEGVQLALRDVEDEQARTLRPAPRAR